MIPRKGSRSIVVDGRPYLWMARGNPATLMITVQEDVDKPGQLLQCALISKKWSPILNDDTIDGDPDHKASLYPRDVETLIRAALGLGWNPREGKGPFRPGNVSLEEYRAI